MSRIITPELISGCGDIIFLNNRHHMSLGGFAFQGCSSMTLIELPVGLTRIGAHAFSGCSSMKSVPRLPMLL